MITEFTVRVTREDFSAVTAEEFDGGVRLRFDHGFCLGSFVYGR